MNKMKVIFIVEDDPGFNMMMTSYLTEKFKWKIYSFPCGEDSLEKLDLKPDIFLQDLDLPGINGIEVMKRVKQKLPATEFIFLSAQTGLKAAVDTIELGAFDYIVKDKYAKENSLNKIDQVLKIMNYLERSNIDRKTNKILVIMALTLIGSLILSLLI